MHMKSAEDCGILNVFKNRLKNSAKFEFYFYSTEKQNIIS